MEQMTKEVEVSKPERRSFKLTRIVQETHDIKSFYFEPSDGKEMFRFKPGHFVNISFKNNDSIGRRSFSIANSPTEEGMMLTVKLVGVFTHALFNTQEGEEFSVLGPLGLPYIRNEDEDLDYAMISGGSGIVPFRSLIRYSQDTDFKKKLTLFYSNKTREDICFFNEIENMQKEMENLRVVNTLTREEPEGWQNTSGHELGRLGIKTFRSYIQDFSRTKFILCGPPGLVKAMVGVLKEFEIPMSQIKTESWGN